MSSNVAFLVAAVGVAVLGSVLMWLRHRKPTTFSSSIDDFQREMRALAREPDQQGRSRRRKEASRPIVPAQPHPELAQKLRDARDQVGRGQGEG